MVIQTKHTSAARVAGGAGAGVLNLAALSSAIRDPASGDYPKMA